MRKRSTSPQCCAVQLSKRNDKKEWKEATFFSYIHINQADDYWFRTHPCTLGVEKNAFDVLRASNVFMYVECTSNEFVESILDALHEKCTVSFFDNTLFSAAPSVWRMYDMYVYMYV